MAIDFGIGFEGLDAIDTDHAFKKLFYAGVSQQAVDRIGGTIGNANRRNPDPDSSCKLAVTSSKAGSFR